MTQIAPVFVQVKLILKESHYVYSLVSGNDNGIKIMNQI